MERAIEEHICGADAGGREDVRIAVVASACEFPDSSTPAALWETVLRRRRTFRRIPSERLRVAEYLRRGDSDPDGLYPIEAAVIEGYRFDCSTFRIPKHTFDATDLTHWLALDVATRAVQDLPGWGSDEALCDATAVVVANTLTGEFSRSALMRGRWPFVSQCLQRVLADTALPTNERMRIAQAMEQHYKEAFTAPSEETLAGGLSNTIAGRISNFHGLRGGAYTVDGACASSLLALANAASLLRAGDASCAVVGGVDLSIDPFELIGFARNGALARNEMRVFDASSNGFWPGEGCGFVVLATSELVEQKGWPVLAWLRGWGISTDGRGGLTRPTVDGQRLALRRAYARAGLSPACVDYFEAHGTGTQTGDPVELQALAEELAACGSQRRHPVGSIKANIGHTKAAAGMAGFLNALAIANTRIAPALAGLQRPHPFTEKEAIQARLQLLSDAQQLAGEGAAIVSASGFGFGGVNAHVIVEGVRAQPHEAVVRPASDATVFASELLLLSAPTAMALVKRVERLLEIVTTLSRGEMVDLAAALADEKHRHHRAYVIAETPQRLEEELRALHRSLLADDRVQGAFHRHWGWRKPMQGPPVIAFVFSGQGQTLAFDAAAWKRRLPATIVADEGFAVLASMDRGDTAVMQALLAEIAIEGVNLLRAMGITPQLCLGHSFGELSALHAAGVLDAEALRTLARERGQAMLAATERPGAMVRVALPAHEARLIANAHDCDVACHNGPASIVISGERSRIEALAAEARKQGTAAVLLPTRVAFHSREMLAAVEPFRRALGAIEHQCARATLVSTITGAPLRDEDVNGLLLQQLTSPVLFSEAASHLSSADLVIEVGAGDTMCTLLSELTKAPCVSIDLYGRSLVPCLHAVGRAWALGVETNAWPLFKDRGTRAFDEMRTRSFFSNPCDRLPFAAAADPVDIPPPAQPAVPMAAVTEVTDQPGEDIGADAIQERLRHALTSATGLPASAITGDTRMLSDLHMNSLRVRHVVTQVARELAIASLPFELAELANAPLRTLVEHLHSARAGSRPVTSQNMPAGIAAWVRPFEIRWEPTGERIDRFVRHPHPDAQTQRIFHGPHWPDGMAAHSRVELPQASRHMHFFAADASFGIDSLPRFLSSVQEAIRDERCAAMVFIQTEARLDGFVRSLSKEHPRRRLCVLTVREISQETVSAGCAWALAGEGFTERRVEADGSCAKPGFCLAALHTEGGPSLPGPQDAVLITGGAKGIGAEVALFFAQRGCRIGLVGRSTPDDRQVAATVARLRAVGARVAYACADLRDIERTHEAIDALIAVLGPMTVFVHAAGINQPCLIERLDAAELIRTVEAKTTSLLNVLRHPSSPQFNRVVAFGSVISEIGLAGEAHYALANQWLGNAVRDWAAMHPSCQAQTICWTAWREAGMAVRLDGVLDSLARDDTHALATDEALAMFEQLLSACAHGRATAVVGRHGLRPSQPSPLESLQCRFLEVPCVHYPGVELVADAHVRGDSDRYLHDHAPSGVQVFPVVFAIEAMVQCACAITGRTQLPVIRDLSVHQAISFAPGEAVTLRTRALVQHDGSVLLDILSGNTAFSMSHFTARAHWSADAGTVLQLPVHGVVDGFPAAGLYGNLLFHGPMFRALNSFTHVRAKACSATLVAPLPSRWFSALLPSRFIAGDPALRDAMIHCLQACVPQTAVLPVSVARIDLGVLSSPSRLLVSGVQTWSDGKEFLFDVEARSETGELAERWSGLRLRRVAGTASHADRRHVRGLPFELLGAFVERLTERLGADIDLLAGANRGDGRRSQRRQRALAAAMGAGSGSLRHDRHGAPRLKGHHVSVSHDDKLSLVVACASRPIGCDLQRMQPYRDDEWAAILGVEHMAVACRLSFDLQEPLGVAALRVWTVIETLVKLGRRDWPLPHDAWSCEATDLGMTAIASARGLRIATSSFRFDDEHEPCVVAIGVDDAAAPSLPGDDIAGTPGSQRIRTAEVTP